MFDNPSVMNDGGLMDQVNGVIAGMLLGDGSLHTNTAPHLRLSHTLPQTNYLDFKLNIASQLGYRVKRHPDYTQNTTLGMYTYATGSVTGPDLAKYVGIPKINLVNFINKLGLLIWWLDDGCLSIHQKLNGSISRFGYLNTQSFSFTENQFICDKLYELFGLTTAIHIDSVSGLALKDHYRIYLNAENMRRLIDLVREFIPLIPIEMRYKFNMCYVKNRLSQSEYFTEYYNF